MGARRMTITTDAEDNMELIYPSLSEEIRIAREKRKEIISGHVANMAIMLEEIKRWHK